MKRIPVILAMLTVFVMTTALADTVTDTIMGIGTTQAFTDEAVAVLLIGRAEESTDAVSSASVRDSLETKTSITE